MPRKIEESTLSVRVELGSRSYSIVIVTASLDSFPAFVSRSLQSSWAGRATRRGLIVTDENVAALSGSYTEALGAIGIETECAVIPPGEASKGLDRAAVLLDRLAAMRADRHTLVVALGGGVVGDLAGFVAATYARGVPLLMIPTSLLAQVDSSVGGKVGVNLPRAKNIVGAFHQPVGVWIDTRALATLPDRERRCGLAEVVKYGVILDAAFFDALEADVERIEALEPGVMRAIVATSCRLKAEVVSKDEREETGLRAVLNFGHTVGHAIEAVAGYGGTYQHGEAVAVGMVVESRIAERLGWIDAAITARIEALLRRFGLPTAITGLDIDALLDAMTRDKKNQHGRIRFVLPRRIGHVELTDEVRAADAREALRACHD